MFDGKQCPVLLWHVQCAATLTETLRLFQSPMPVLLKFPESDKQRRLAAPRFAAIRFLGFGTVIAFLTHGWAPRERTGAWSVRRALATRKGERNDRLPRTRPD